MIKQERLDKYLSWLEQARANGAELVGYDCPHCQKILQTFLPPVGEVSDSTVLCPHCDCGALFFKVVNNTPNFVKVSVTIIQEGEKQ